MENVGHGTKPVLIIGNGRLTFSITVCLLQAKHKVTLYTENGDDALASINTHCAELKQPLYKSLKQSSLEITDHLAGGTPYGLVIAITNEDLAEKKDLIHELEKIVSATTTIAINTESISLGAIQQDAINPERILGVNWSEPAHTTLFLELIANKITKQEVVDDLLEHAKLNWKKNPYMITGDTGIRARMISAIAREAFFLVENGYATIEDIDRACRNDPGYYLSFAGNFRYMDLMGACGYGEVMKDLNPELSKAKAVPEFFSNIIKQGHLGIENNKGLYEYSDEDAAKWEETFRRYSYQIQQIIEKYPFG